MQLAHRKSSIIAEDIIERVTMKLKPDQVGVQHVGCVCAVRYAGTAFGFSGHSARYGLEGSGAVPSSELVVGRLCHADEEKLLLLTAWKRSHSTGLSFSMGPHHHVELYNVTTIRRERLNSKVPIYVNIAEKSSSIRQHFLHRDRRSGIWQTWPQLARHWDEL